MGECISLVAKISQILNKNGFANTTKLISENVQREGSRGINPKLSIKMTKSANFDKLTEDIVLKQWTWFFIVVSKCIPYYQYLILTQKFFYYIFFDISRKKK